MPSHEAVAREVFQQSVLLAYRGVGHSTLVVSLICSLENGFVPPCGSVPMCCHGSLLLPKEGEVSQFDRNAIQAPTRVHSGRGPVWYVKPLQLIKGLVACMTCRSRRT